MCESLPDALRAACRKVVGRARSVTIEVERIPAYARELAPLLSAQTSPQDVSAETRARSVSAETRATARELLAARWLTLDAINFGSGWFPTLRKRPGRSGYGTVAAGLEERFATLGPWSAAQLTAIGTGQLAEVLGQDPGHELIGLFATSLRSLGSHLEEEFDGAFSGPIEAAGGSAVALVATLSEWDCFADLSSYAGIAVPFLKRAQIACADLDRAGAASFADLGRLTMFADNLVPHVLRLDGVLSFGPELVARIDREELITHGSPEEVEIRACAVSAVELLVEALPGVTAARLDQLLWMRGGGPVYKAAPRHRSRCTAY